MTVKLKERFAGESVSPFACGLSRVGKFYILKLKPSPSIRPFGNRYFPAVCFSYPLDNGQAKPCPIAFGGLTCLKYSPTDIFRYTWAIVSNIETCLAKSANTNCHTVRTMFDGVAEQVLENVFQPIIVAFDTNLVSEIECGLGRIDSLPAVSTQFKQ